MALVVKCRCGQAFRAQPELAGKQVKCPTCGSVLVIPQARVEQPGIVVACQCGGRFVARSSLAGQAVRCPNCAATIQVPLPGSPDMSPSDPLAGLDLEAGMGSAPAPLPANAALRAPVLSGRTAAPRKKTSAGSNTGRKVLWIVLAVVGGGFGLLCLFCGGLAVIGLRHARQAATFERDVASFGDSAPGPGTASGTAGGARQTLLEARTGFATKIVRTGEPAGPPENPAGSDFDLIRYTSPAGSLAAYLTRDPRDGKKHPAIVWITGGDNNSIGDVWSPSDRRNDQSAGAFRKAGLVMMFPSQRGGNDNPGRREGFYGEVDDILAATDHLAQLAYVDPAQIYLGGHSTGGTMAMVTAECTDRFKAVFALGPVALASQYGGEFIYCDPRDQREIALRSPLPWLHCVKSPLYVFEGASDGNWEAIQIMAKVNTNPQIHFFKAAGHTHFSIIAPLTERLADQIVRGQVNITEQTVAGL